MRTLRYMVLALLVVFVVIVVVGLLLPSKVHLERNIEIKRDKQTIFRVINSLDNFNQWSPWYDLDINAKYMLAGAESGVGATLSWEGNDKVGTGSTEIIESVQDSYIKTKMLFGKSDAPVYSKIALQQAGNTTKVTWSFENDFGYNIFFRYFGLVLEDMIAPDYERGLAKLKNYIESQPLAQ
ncbi:MAG: SRPBCC family protein [Proteobacteria bacterium]|nr:SRPBCC family protein [Pseudomonadota bacterium]